MTGYYVIAAVSGRYVLNMHSKVYFNKKLAQNALKKMKDSGKITEIYTIYEITDFKEATV